MISFFLFLFVTLQVETTCHLKNDEKNFLKLDSIELPIEINSFSDFTSSNKCQINDYNDITKIGIGYFGVKGRFHKKTSKYSTNNLTREYERCNNGSYEKYSLKDSVKLSFIERLNLYEEWNCLLVKIEVPVKHRTAYYYQLLSFDKNRSHISTINVFELIDDAATKDWIQERPSPNSIVDIKETGEIIVTWDEGNDVCEQFIELNDHGIFVETKLRFHDRHKYYDGKKDDYREVKNVNEINYYK